MKWFRKHVKQGSRLALLALAIQFALSFGHFHGFTVQAAPASISALTSATDTASIDAQTPSQPSPASQHDDQQPSDTCAICTVMALASAVMVSPPPVLFLPQAAEFLYLATDAEFLHLKSVGAAFQPRAPPAS